MPIRRTVALAALGMLCSALPNAAEPQQVTPAKPAAPTTQARVNEDALLLQDFKTRIDRYVEIHNKVAKEAPPLKETNNPAEILVRQTTFAEKLRQARPDAKHGDIFTPEIQQKFRRLLAPQLKGEDGQDAKKVLKDDAPPAVTLKVNANYPPGAALPTVPAKILMNLPTLPEALEYRIVNRDLILRDTKGDIVADFIANAIP